MYTQCTECEHPCSITVEHLRTSHAMLCCESCSSMFDALELLNEGSIPVDSSIQQFSVSNDNINATDTSNQQKKYWGLGTILLCLTLIYQVYFFESYNLSQNTMLRPWLQKMCTLSTWCQLADYQNLDEISILEGSFEPINNHYQFKTIFINQSLFAQKRPSIKLTLLDFTGTPVAKRVFYPADYSKQPKTLLEPNYVDKIILSIAAPSSKIGGYRFELI